MWLCENNDTKEVYAYAVGTYNASTGLFSDVDYGLTYAGNEHIPATNSEASANSSTSSSSEAVSTSAE